MRRLNQLSRSLEFLLLVLKKIVCRKYFIRTNSITTPPLLQCKQLHYTHSSLIRRMETALDEPDRKQEETHGNERIFDQPVSKQRLQEN